MLIAILGRGVQSQTQDSADLRTTFWESTEDLEVYSPTLAHSVKRFPVDDRNPSCLIGGGKLNLLAGVELHRREPAELMVCAYGARSSYLEEVGAPSESELMSFQLESLLEEQGLARPLIHVWHRAKVLPGRKANTLQELENIFGLAVDKGICDVSIVTVTVHLPRTIAFARDHLAKDEFSHLKVCFFASELVLVEANPELYAPRVLKLYASEAFRRNAFYERRGTLAFLGGNY